MKKYFLLIIFVILLSSFIYAEPSYFYKRDAVIDLKEPCVNNGQACPISATCNITVNYPNSTVMINNQQMTNQITYFNYTITDTNNIGEYVATVFCIDGTDYGYNSFIFDISDNGQKSNDYTFIIALGLVAAFILCLGFIINIGVYTIPYKLTSMLFSLLTILLIPATFTAFDTKTLFWFLFMGYLIISILILVVYGLHELLQNMGMVRKSK